MALHAKAWKLARHGGIRTRRSGNPMSGSPNSRQADADRGGRRLAGQSQQASRQGRLAIHNRHRPHQAEKPIPSVRSGLTH